MLSNLWTHLEEVRSLGFPMCNFPLFLIASNIQKCRKRKQKWHSIMKMKDNKFFTLADNTIQWISPIWLLTLHNIITSTVKKHLRLDVEINQSHIKMINYSNSLPWRLLSSGENIPMWSHEKTCHHSFIQCSLYHVFAPLLTCELSWLLFWHKNKSILQLLLIILLSMLFSDNFKN